MGKLIVLGTTIGNIEGISLRGVRAIFETPIILAEDTRVFNQFKGLLKERYKERLSSLEIDFDNKQKVISYREQVHDQTISTIIKLIKDSDVAIVSDAGMPAISDPGWKLIRDAIEAEIEIDVIPGATAVESALVLSGLPTDRFTFLGFLPRTKGKAKKLIEPYLNSETTVILFESPFRVLKTLELVCSIKFNKKKYELKASAVNDITKKFQKIWRGEISSVIAELKSVKLKGEWVLCLRKS